MSDYNSSLPVRTETNGDIVVKIVDGTLTSQTMTVNADGSVNITDNGGSLTVDAIDLDIRDLTSASDSVEVLQTTHDNLNANVTIQVADTDVSNSNPVPVSDAGGSLTVDGSVSATNFPSTVDTNFGAVGVNTIRVASELGNTTGAADFNAGATGAQTLRTAANLHLSGTAVSTTNPIPVTITADNIGIEINDYNTSPAIAANATSNHDYTVTAGKTLLLDQVEGTASGKMKIEVQVETGVATGVFTTKFVQFNSTANSNMSIRLKSPISVAAGVRVRVIRTNKDNQAMDVYSTICGQEI